MGAAVFAHGAPDKRDFSGRWRMLKDRSDFSGFKMPDIVTRSVDQHGVVMNVHTVQTLGTKTSISDVFYSTDGASTDNVVDGRDAKTKTFWDGDVLVVRTKMKTSKGELEIIEDHWSLSDDRQMLTTTSHIETETGQVDMTMVCSRQSGK